MNITSFHLQLALVMTQASKHSELSKCLLAVYMYWDLLNVIAVADYHLRITMAISDWYSYIQLQLAIQLANHGIVISSYIQLCMHISYMQVIFSYICIQLDMQITHAHLTSQTHAHTDVHTHNHTYSSKSYIQLAIYTIQLPKLKLYPLIVVANLLF